jgi:hypothetical protein
VAQAVRVDRARIHLDRELVLVAFVEAERAAQCRHQRVHLLVVEIGWRTTPEVQLCHQPGAVEQLRLHDDLTMQHLHVSIDPHLIARDDLVAAAVIAERMTERDVHV